MTLSLGLRAELELERDGIAREKLVDPLALGRTLGSAGSVELDLLAILAGHDEGAYKGERGNSVSESEGQRLLAGLEKVREMQ